MMSSVESNEIEFDESDLFEFEFESKSKHN